MRVYLAGPDVFLPDAEARGAELKSICAQHGLAGVFPLDSLPDEPPARADLPQCRRIALCNEAHIRRCDALIANLTPFRGPSADAGTIFELGFMRALCRPVFAWSRTEIPLAARTLNTLGATATRAPDGTWRDGEGLLVEDFGCTDNLMIDGGVKASGGMLVTRAVPVERRWTDLEAFAVCVAEAARVLGV
jgi:nucleoside 2-deoxyribosyltransferase